MNCAPKESVKSIPALKVFFFSQGAAEAVHAFTTSYDLSTTLFMKGIDEFFQRVDPPPVVR